MSDAASASSHAAEQFTPATNLGDLLWEVTTYCELLGEAGFADTPLTLPSSGMLQSVVAAPGITVAEISRQIPKTQQAISQVAARLEKLGFIERRIKTGRGVGLYPTDTGRQWANEAQRREVELDARVRELLGADRYDALRPLLSESLQILREAR